jgi:hypothetical protein
MVNSVAPPVILTAYVEFIAGALILSKNLSELPAPASTNSAELKLFELVLKVRPALVHDVDPNGRGTSKVSVPWALVCIENKNKKARAN